jgi:hypothetical protein
MAAYISSNGKLTVNDKLKIIWLDLGHYENMWLYALQEIIVDFI